MSVQPDLFGEYDERERQRALWNQPHTCPRCGQTEPNGLLLSSNHGITPGTDSICGYPRGEHPNYGERCVAQDLARNHIIYAARPRDPEELARLHRLGIGADLERDMARGRELGLDVDAIAAEAKRYWSAVTA